MMNNRDKFFITLMFMVTFIGSAICFDRIETMVKTNHAEIITELKHSNQIELELIDAVNLMNNKRHIQSPDVNCEAIATFLDSLEKAKHNRIKKGDLLK